MKNLFYEKIDNGLNEVLGRIYNEYHIETGGITPEQQLKYDELVNVLSDLFEELIKQNYKNVKLFEDDGGYKNG